MERRLQQIFFALSLLALVLIVIAVWQASAPSWKTYQRSFQQLEAQGEPDAAARAAILSAPPEIHQIMVPGLQRVDRCTTCHLGVDDPTMKNAPEPFRYHAGLGGHISTKFGCTVCHGGQGLATDTAGAHGNVEHWQTPLLPADYVRASCGRCHKDGEVPGVPELAEGRRLFDTQGCRGCHKLNGVGGSIGPDLTAEGAGQRAPDWLERHFLNPSEVSAGSAMPNQRFTRQQARSLTYYMLSFTGAQMGNYYLSLQLIPGAAVGRQIFVEKNCIACHAVGGVGAKNSPDLLGVTQRHSAQWLDEQLRNPDLVYPGSAMPQYDLESNARKALVAYMASTTSEDARSILSHLPRPLTAEEAGIEAGHQNYIRFGCAGCHGTELQGGVPNPNAQGGETPSLLHAADDYTKDEVIKLIGNGRSSPLASAKLPAPPLYMPSWKATISTEDISRIADYLWSKQEKKAEEAW